jgi:hypothetical protein
MKRLLMTTTVIILFAAHSFITGGGRGPAYLYDIYLLCQCVHEDGYSHSLNEYEIKQTPDIKRDAVAETDADERCNRSVLIEHICPKKVQLKNSAYLLHSINFALYTPTIRIFSTPSFLYFFTDSFRMMGEESKMKILRPPKMV